MNPEAFAQAEQLYQTLLPLEPEQRHARLAAVSDAQLRQAVERLLAANEQTGTLLQSPAVVVPDAHEAMPRGRTLGHYRLQSLLGKGGMGEVYLAEDTQLERQVALKVLPATFTGDADRVRRFAREAKAASGLNHPNILTIHEIGHEQNTHYIATEYIAGEMLRQRLAREKLSLQATLDIAIQIASALAAAHEAGIIHRDIKPENVMLRQDGIVKVLDFGLAKLTEKQTPAPHDSEAPTLIQHTTDAGTVMGTASYMSPEQARGEKVDARADLFSLGVVLYEMLAGRAPFAGVNALDVIGAILNQEPAPLTNSASDVPAELQRIVTKALRKERDERYQNAKDLLLDVKTLQQELEFAARLKGVQAAEAEATATIIQPAEGATQAVAATNTTSSASIILAELKRHKRGVAIAVAAMVVLAGGAGFWLYRLLGQNKAPAASSALKITRLTSTGKATRAAISPDGKFVVYAQDEGGQQSLWVTQVAAASNSQIVPPAADVIYRGITFALDGNFIYYVRADKENPSGALWQSPVLGGNARKLLVNIRCPIAFSPDGKQFAFVRGDRSGKETALMIANADGSAEDKLAIRKSPDYLPMVKPAWSPDGKIIACSQVNRTGGVYTNVVGVRVMDGVEQPITSHRWGDNVGMGIAWLSDNSGLLVTGVEQGGQLPQIWYLAWPGDEAHSVTNDLSGYTDLTLTADSSTLAALRAERMINLWITPSGETSRAKQITTGAGRDDGIRGLAWTPDGRIVYRSVAGGNSNAWIMATDGVGNKQLSANVAQNEDLAVTLDGRYIVWASRQTRNGNIWRMEIDGSNPKQLTNGDGEFTPQVSPDGKWVVYWSVRDGMLWKIPIDGGDPVQVTDKAAVTPVFSMDGKLIACNYWDEASGRYKIAVIPFAGGPPVKIFDELGGFNRPLQWTPDGRAIAFIRTTNGVSNLWAQPLDSGQPKQLTEFKDQRIFNFAWSRDGKQLALSRGVVNSDVVLLSGFK